MNAFKARFCVLAVVGCASSIAIGAPNAKPKPTKTKVERAKAYAKKYDLPTRQVQVRDRGGNQVKRLFVPVMQHTEPEFLAKFSTKDNTVIWRLRDTDNVHAHVMLAPNDHMGFELAPHSDHSAKLGASVPGKYVTMELTRKEIKHMVKRWELLGDKAMHDRETGREVVKPKNAVDEQRLSSSGCMWWLVYAETAPKVSLATTLGTTRSGAPENLIRKILHEAGTRVSVVGIPVNSVEDFRAMTDEALLGPAPKKKAGDQ